MTHVSQSDYFGRLASVLATEHTENSEFFIDLLNVLCVSPGTDRPGTPVLAPSGGARECVAQLSFRNEAEISSAFGRVRSSLKYAILCPCNRAQAGRIGLNHSAA
jgi:hypothetical protein